MYPFQAPQPEAPAPAREEAPRWTEAELIQMMEDTSGYFPAGDFVDMRPHLLLLYTLARYSTSSSFAPYTSRPPVCLEIGVRQGVSTVAILMAMRRNGGKLISLDVDPVETARALEVIRAQKLDRYWEFHLESSATFPVPPEIDFLWIDGDHLHPAPSRDVIRYAPALRIGGIMAMHDYYVPPGGDDGVTLAVDKIVKACGAFEVVTLPWGYGLTICRKVAEVSRGWHRAAGLVPPTPDTASEPQRYRW